MLARLFPITHFIRVYDREVLRADLSAGLTVGVMLIPQGMAYALIAGVPPIYGLYAGLVPLVVYALMGSSRQLAVGPVAIVSLLVAAGVGPLAGGDPELYLALTFTLALMVGVLQAAMGLLRFGFLTNFLSHPVLAGFTSAAAIIIGVSQLRHLVGVDLGGGAAHEIVLTFLSHITEIHIPTLLVGIAGIALQVGLKRWRKTFPGALTVVILGTGAVWLFGIDATGVRTIGAVPGGLPSPVMPPLDRELMLGLLPAALTIALVGFMESIAVAKVFATRHRYRIDANQELLALGTANLAGSFFQAFPTTGGFSRTAVNNQSGARTTVASLISAGVIALTLLFLTDLFTQLPNAILAAIIMAAVANLFDWKEARHLWQCDRRDFWMMTITFAMTLALGIEEGILAGVIISLGALVYQSSRPHSAVTGRLPGTRTFRNVERHSAAEQSPGITVLRIDAALSFANASFFIERVEGVIDSVPPPETLVLDFHAVNGLDSSAAAALREALELLSGREVGVQFAGVMGPVMDAMRKHHLVEQVGEERFHFEVAEAVDAATPASDILQDRPPLAPLS
ncbi:sulfate permease [soil metagenome]